MTIKERYYVKCIDDPEVLFCTNDLFAGLDYLRRYHRQPLKLYRTLDDVVIAWNRLHRSKKPTYYAKDLL